MTAGEAVLYNKITNKSIHHQNLEAIYMSINIDSVHTEAVVYLSDGTSRTVDLEQDVFSSKEK
jgi:hypothetical protein